MSKKTLAQKLTVDWTEIYLEAQRALNYLEENKTAPVKSAHKVLASNVKKRVRKILWRINEAEQPKKKQDE